MKGMLSELIKRSAVLVVVSYLVAGMCSTALADETTSLNIKFVKGLSPLEQEAVVTNYGGVLKSSVPQLDLVTADFPSASLSDTIASLKTDPLVVRVEVNATRKVEALPNDVFLYKQWALPKIGWDQVYGLALPAAGTTAKVAILDTGIDALHPDLAGKVLIGTSMLDGSGGMTDPNGHGTWLAGIVASNTDNNEGIAGVAYAGVQMIPVQVIAANGEGQDSDVIAGVMWAADNGADVILMGFSNPGRSDSLQDAIDYAWSKDIVLVAAAGNDALSDPTFPAGDRGVIGVSATDSNDNLSAFSNFGASVFLAAPGEDIFSTDLNDSYVAMSGTSGSAGVVAGVAAFMRAMDPELSNGVIVGRLARSADPAGSTDPTVAVTLVGNGRVNMPRALADTSTDPIQPAGVDGGGGPFVGPYKIAARNWTLTFAGTGGGSVTITVPSGDTVNAPTSCGGTGTNTTSQTVTSTCSPNITLSNNSATGTLKAIPNGTSFFAGWRDASNFSGCSGTTNPCNFSVTQSSPKLTVTFTSKTALTVTADSKNKVYGDADPTLTYQITSGSLNSGDASAGALTRVAGENVGTYAIQQGTLRIENSSGVDVTYMYTITFNGADLTISKRSVTVKADAKSKTYGDDNPALTATVTGTVNGDTLNYSLATTAEKFSGVGDYAITVTLGSNPNYNVTKTDSKLHINARDASVTADNKSKTYGEDNPALTATVAGTINGDTLNYSLATTAEKFSGVGDYAITVTLGSNPNYNVTKTDGKLHINARDASVTADNKSKTYGEDNPALTATVAGTVNGDTLNFTLATTAVKFSNVGIHPITVTLGSNPNYNVTPTNGTLTVGARSATVTADNKSKTYGDDNPALTATMTGMVNGDILNFMLATTALKFSGVGDYPITVTLGSNPNYNVFKTDGNLHINVRDASVAANPKSKTYGDDNPALTATVTGPVNGDALNYSLATTATKFSGVGDYAITVTLGSNPNYNVTKTDSNLHIQAKSASVAADNQSKTYGDDNPALTAIVVGTVNGDILNFTLSTTALKFSGVGDYPITVAPGVNPNYDVTPTNGTLHISAKAATVTVDNKIKIYGQDNPSPTATVTGTVNGDTLDYSLATPAEKSSGAGDYLIVVALGSNPNYEVTSTNGILHIDKAPTTMKVSSDPVKYGEPVILAATVTSDPSGATGDVEFSYAKDSIMNSIGTAQFSTVIGWKFPTICPAPNPDNSVPPFSFRKGVSGAFSNVSCKADSGTPPFGLAARLADGPYFTITTPSSPSSGFSIEKITFAASADIAIEKVILQLTDDKGTLIDELGDFAPNDQPTIVNIAHPDLTLNAETTYQIHFVAPGSPATLTLSDLRVVGQVTGDISVLVFDPGNAGTHSTEAKYSGDDNYKGSNSSGSETIDKADATIRVTGYSGPYDGKPHGATGTATGVKDEDLSSLLHLGDSFTNVPGGTVHWTFDGNDNYNASSGDVDIKINKKAATITADNKVKTYGQANPALTATVEGQVAGGDAINYSLATTATQFSSVAGSPYPITVTLGSNPNYDVTTTDGKLTVNKAVATVKADNKTKTYGQANPDLTATVEGQVAGGDAINYSLATTATQFSSVTGSPYPITVTLGSNPNYDVSKTDGTLTVNKALATVAADAKSKFYGQDSPALTAVVTGAVAGGDPVNYTLATTALKLSGVGSYPITVTLGGNPNYDVTTTDGTLTVNKAVATVKADNKVKTYGEANPALTATVEGQVAGGDAINYSLATTATQFSSVTSSPYPITVTLGSNPNYTVTATDSTLTVNAKPATITADNKSKTYGDANPTLTAIVTGTVGSDTLNYTLATTATAASGVGSYPITVTLGSNPNYGVSQTDGTLTVTAASLTITADNKSKVYGAVLPALTANYSGFVNGDGPASLTTPVVLNTTATAASPVGDYPITPSVAASPNYNISFVNGTLNVTAAPLKITAEDAGKTYGATNPVFSVSYAGFVNGDDASKLGGTLTFTTSATQSSPAGSYDVMPGGLTSANYAITFVKGVLTVNPAGLTITTSPATRTYGQPNPAFSVSYAGLVNGDDTSKLGGTLAFTTSATVSSPAGSYDVMPGGLTSANYAITFVKGVLTVNPAALTITTSPATKTYGQPNPVFSVSYAGFVNGDNASKLGGILAFTTSATQSSAVGSYDIMPGGLTSGNYTITYVKGTLTVNPAALTITAKDASKTYGTTLTPAGTEFATSGLVNGDTVASVTLASAGYAAGATVTGSPFSITPSAAVGAALGNYTITYANGKLTINQAALTIAAKNASKTFGQLLTFAGTEFTTSGLVNGDTVTKVTLTSTGTPMTAPLGVYDIVPSAAVGTGLGNYTISYVNGTFTVGTTKFIIPIDATIHTVDQRKTGICGYEPNGKPRGECNNPADQSVDAKVFDMKSPAFLAAYGKDPDHKIYDEIYESTQTIGVNGLNTTCPTDSYGEGLCFVSGVSDYLVLVKEIGIDNVVRPINKIKLYAGKKIGAGSFQSRPTTTEFTGPWKSFIADAGTLWTKDADVHVGFHIIRTIKKDNDPTQDGRCDYSDGNRSIYLGSYLEVVYPGYTVWEEGVTDYVYPFILTGDTDWTLDVCAAVPTGYQIVGVYDTDGNMIATNNCVQAGVAGETKVIAFEVLDLQSPPPHLSAKVKIHHKGADRFDQFEIGGYRKGKDKKAR